MKILFGILAVALLTLSLSASHASGDCNDVLDKIEAERWDAVSNYEMSYYGAGLALSHYYIEKDCSTAVDKINEELEDMYSQNIDDGILEKFEAGVRFSINALKDTSW